MALQGHIDSYYAASAHGFEDHAALNESIQADICIVGGGYTGLSTALHLAEKGYQVTLLEAENVGWGASGRNGGHVGVGQRIEQDALEKMVGLEHAKTLWQYGI
jgi:gamma-glutamylputrescine oxidase